jgi:hypothetical protein
MFTLIAVASWAILGGFLGAGFLDAPVFHWLTPGGSAIANHGMIGDTGHV